MLYELSVQSLARIDRQCRREHLPPLTRMRIDEQEDCLQEIVLSLLESPDNPDRSIRRGIRRWKSTRDIMTIPQKVGRRFQVTLFSEIVDENSADRWD
jgi:hypothetical protein